MMAAVIIAGLLTVIAAKSRAVGPALVLGVITVVLLGVVAPGFIAGVGHVLAAIAGGIGDGITRAASD